jgi:DNA topoisomerase I
VPATTDATVRHISGLPEGGCSPRELAELAGLRYVGDTEAGITRTRSGSGFQYGYPNGRPVRKEAHLERISALAIPPAWAEVWICRTPDGHLQATGRDDRGRKQYIYHERWGEISNLAKFARMHAFGRTLPTIRRFVWDALDEAEPTLRKTCATLVALLDHTYARIGNEEYVRANRSFGLSTLRRKHLTVNGRSVRVSFAAKGGEERSFTVDDPRLARILRAGMESRGYRVFRYADEEGRLKDLGADQVNDFLREIAGEAFTAKDFRTWKASALVAGELFRRREEAADEEAREEIVREAIDLAAEKLGNTRSVCRMYYTHPTVIESFQDGSFAEAMDGFRPVRRKWLDHDEQVLLRLLRHFDPERPASAPAGT